MKTIIVRGAIGFPLGVFVSTFITLCISLGIGDGTFYAVVPSLIETMGTELNAYLLQFILSGLLGVAFAAGSIIFEHDNWSLTKQTTLHFCLVTIAMFPVAYYSHWMEHSFIGFSLYFLIFVIIYLMFWVIQYLFWKREINRLNHSLNKS